MPCSNIYLKPWKAFAKAGGRGAMPAHNTVLDIPCHANDWLVNQVLMEIMDTGYILAMFILLSSYHLTVC